MGDDMATTKTLPGRLVAVVASFAAAIALASLGAAPAQATQDSRLCVANRTSDLVQSHFYWGPDNHPNQQVSVARRGDENCVKFSRNGGPDVSAGVTVGDWAKNTRGDWVFRGTFVGFYYVHNPAIGWPVIAGRVQGHPKCVWNGYTGKCWYARLGQRQHRCLQESGYWVRVSREADSGGAKQFRVVVYDGSADPSSFGC